MLFHYCGVPGSCSDLMWGTSWRVSGASLPGVRVQGREVLSELLLGNCVSFDLFCLLLVCPALEFSVELSNDPPGSQMSIFKLLHEKGVYGN